jgi:hypothetical protein
VFERELVDGMRDEHELLTTQRSKNAKIRSSRMLSYRPAL